jgi:hypothetical protein
VDNLMRKNFTEEQIKTAQIVVVTLIAFQVVKLALGLLIATVKYVSNLRENVMLTLFNFIMWMPCGRAYLRKEQKKCQDDFWNRVKSKRQNTVEKLPAKGMPEDEIMKRIKQGS